MGHPTGTTLCIASFTGPLPPPKLELCVDCKDACMYSLIVSAAEDRRSHRGAHAHQVVQYSFSDLCSCWFFCLHAVVKKRAVPI
jgi:hypothetical protein